ncbi:uncharacterized protein [Anabrus simplex]|uniref:uncharacterized protein n=1 Tax=Anabrus simplex TaxID=316456 RepID=UPI0035A3AEEB
MGCFGRKAYISAAIFTLVEAVIWTILNIVGLLVYYCAFHVGWNDFTVQYFYNPDICQRPTDLGIRNPIAKKTGFILIYYTVISVLWIATSLTMMCGARGKLTGLTFYPWFVTVIITLLSDVTAMILFILDMNKDAILSKNAAIFMAVFSIRAGVLWLINSVVLWLSHKSYLQERHENRHTKKVADGHVLPTHSNWIFAADHVRQNGKNQFEEHETPYEQFSPERQDMPPRHHISPITDPIVEELRKSFGDPNRTSPYRREPSRDDSPGWNSPYGHRERSNGPPKFEALEREVNQRDGPYRTEPERRDERRYNNGPSKRMVTSYHNDQNRVLNYEPGRRNVPHSGGQKRDDVMSHNRPYNGGYNPQKTVQSGEPRRWNGDHRDDSLRRDHIPHALSGIASGGRRFDTHGDWEHSQVHDKPYRRDDHNNKRENALQRPEGTRIRSGDSVKSDADSVRSEDVKRTSKTTHPKGLQNQYPWSYVLPQINSALALKKKQLMSITDDKVEDEERPPVPVPDYTLHFNRQSERPGLDRTSSGGSSQPQH